MHSTKLSLGKWLLAMHLIVNSSKGISSVYLGELVGGGPQYVDSSIILKTQQYLL